MPTKRDVPVAVPHGAEGAALRDFSNSGIVFVFLQQRISKSSVSASYLPLCNAITRFSSMEAKITVAGRQIRCRAGTLWPPVLQEGKYDAEKNVIWHYARPGASAHPVLRAPVPSQRRLPERALAARPVLLADVAPELGEVFRAGDVGHAVYCHEALRAA